MKVRRINKQIAAVMGWILVFAITAGSLPMPARGEDSSAQTVKLYPADDAYVRGGTYANNNFGSSSGLNVKNVLNAPGDTREGFLKFDLQSVPGEIRSAKLFFYGAVTDALVSAVDIHLFAAVGDPWTEGSLTWNNKPARGASVATAVNLNRSSQWRSMDVTSFVSAEWQGDRTASMIVAQIAASGAFANIDSKEGGNPPYLEIVYAEPPADTEPPSWPSAAVLQATYANDSSVRLEWPPATDPSGVAGYRLYKDGAFLQTVSGDVYSYEATNLAAGAAYTFEVEAVDGNGNWSRNGPQLTVTMPAGERNLAPTDDTYVQAGTNANTNFGAATGLAVKKEAAEVTREAFLKFDLHSVAEEVGTAELYLYGAVTDGNGTDMDNFVYHVDSAWDEGTMTWNTKPAYEDYVGVFHANKMLQWHAIDVTSYVKRELQGEKQASFGIRQEADKGLFVRFDSKEAAANTPYLKISGARKQAQAPEWGAAAVLAATAPDDTSLALSWPSALHPGGVAGYRIYQNGHLLQEMAGNSLTVEGLASGTSYTFKVEAGDADGNWSNDGPYVTVKLSETKLEQTQLGNVFLSDEPVEFRVVTMRPSVSWSVRNLWGDVVASGRESVADGAAKLTVPLNQVGYFTLEAKAESAGKEPVAMSASFTVFAPYDFRAVEDSPFGINSHFTAPDQGYTPDLTKLIEYAGIKNVRDAISWARVESPKGTYRITPEQDAFVDSMVERRLNLLMNLNYENKFYDNASTPYTDEGREGFANYGKFLMEHFGDKAKAFEVYNEFNIAFGDRGSGPADSRPDYYYPLLAKTYDTLKQANPGKTVAGMTTASVPFGWMEDVFRLGGLNSLDVVTVHPYQFPKPPEYLTGDLRKLEDLVRQYNGGSLKPIWISEIGYPTHSLAAGSDEKEQADYLVRTFVLALAEGVDKIYWHDLMNYGIDRADLEHNYGLIYNMRDPKGKHVPKPAYASYGVLTRQLTGAQFAADESIEGGIRQYKFVNGQEELRVVWAPGQLLPVAIHTEQPIRIVDLMGNEKTYVPHEGKVYYTLKDEAVYVKGAIEHISADSSFNLTGNSSVIGEDGRLELKVDYNGAAPFEGELTVAGTSYPVRAEPGQPLSVTVTVPGLEAEGELAVRGQLTSGGKPLGLLTAQTRFTKPYEIKLRPRFTPDGSGKELDVVVTNRSANNAIVLNEVQWKIGNQTGTVPGPIAIGPAAQRTERIPVQGLQNDTPYTLDATIRIEGYEPVVVASTVNYTPVYHVSRADKPVTIDLGQAINKVKDYGGPDDLSGTVTLSWDEDYLYMQADIRDDKFHYDAVEANMYLNDGFQFGVVRGIPGESAEWYDSGFAQTPAGLQMYHWITPKAANAGLIDGGKLNVTRDEAAKTTSYVAAWPWAALAPIDPDEDDVFSFSLLLNENDGMGRRGYIEWGSGIGATKDPKRYRTVQLIKPASLPPAAPVLTADITEPTNTDVTVTVRYPDDAVVREYKLGEEGSWTTYTGPVAVAANTTVYARGRNAEGVMSATSSYEVLNIDKTAPTATIAYSVTTPTTQDVVASLTASEPVTILNNGGSDRYTFLFNGSFTFEFADAAGNKGTATATVANIGSKSRAKPGKPVLSHDNGYDTGLRDGSYRVTMNMWYGDNGRIYRLYENDVLIDTKIIADNSPSAQTVATPISGKRNGTYRYYAELVNAFGTTRSDTLVVTVTDAAPGKPVLSHDNWDGDGSFRVGMNMWWGTNGTTYRLYENGVLIDEQTLAERTPSAQSAVTSIGGRPVGRYEYRAELANEAGVTASDKIVVNVTEE